MFTPDPDGDCWADCCNIASLCGLIRFYFHADTLWRAPLPRRRTAVGFNLLVVKTKKPKKNVFCLFFLVQSLVFLFLPPFTVLSNTDCWQDSRQRGFIFLFALILRLLPPCLFFYVFFHHVTTVSLIQQQLCVWLTLFFCAGKKTTHD